MNAELFLVVSLNVRIKENRPTSSVLHIFTDTSGSPP